jgi:hypothetical protein
MPLVDVFNLEVKTLNSSDIFKAKPTKWVLIIVFSISRIFVKIAISIK